MRDSAQVVCVLRSVNSDAAGLSVQRALFQALLVHALNIVIQNLNLDVTGHVKDLLHQASLDYHLYDAIFLHGLSFRFVDGFWK